MERPICHSTDLLSFPMSNAHRTTTTKVNIPTGVFWWDDRRNCRQVTHLSTDQINKTSSRREEVRRNRNDTVASVEEHYQQPLKWSTQQRPSLFWASRLFTRLSSQKKSSSHWLVRELLLFRENFSGVALSASSCLLMWGELVDLSKNSLSPVQLLQQKSFHRRASVSRWSCHSMRKRFVGLEVGEDAPTNSTPMRTKQLCNGQCLQGHWMDLWSATFHCGGAHLLLDLSSSRRHLLTSSSIVCLLLLLLPICGGKSDTRQLEAVRHCQGTTLSPVIISRRVASRCHRDLFVLLPSDDQWKQSLLPSSSTKSLFLSRTRQSNWKRSSFSNHRFSLLITCLKTIFFLQMSFNQWSMHNEFLFHRNFLRFIGQFERRTRQLEEKFTCQCFSKKNFLLVCHVNWFEEWRTLDNELWSEVDWLARRSEVRWRGAFLLVSCTSSNSWKGWRSLINSEECVACLSPVKTNYSHHLLWTFSRLT